MVFLLVALAARTTVSAQGGDPRPDAAAIEHVAGDITGAWNDTFHEDFWERRSGLQVGDFTGLPLNEGGKLAAQTWNPGWFSIPEEQCRPHTGIYAPRGPFQLLIEAEYDQNSQRLLAYHLYGGFSSRTIWMDGRAHPDEYARHTFSGFSTGRWDGDTLIVQTTHLKAGYLQRNGAPHSDQATGLEYWRRQGDTLLLTSFIDDPAYLTEPLMRTSSWFLQTDPTAGRAAVFVCTPVQVADESVGRPKNFVPHFLPGQYEQAREFQVGKRIPPEAAAGGADTLYPEYIATFQQKRAEFIAAIAASRPVLRPAPGQPGIVGHWALNRGKSTYNVSWSRLNLDNRDGSAPERRLITIEPIADGAFRTTIDTQVVANDTGVHRQEYTFKVDGSDSQTRGGAVETYAMSQIGANRWERVGKIRGTVVERATYDLSGDGNVLTIKSKGAIGGDRWDNVQVFERQ
jgi:hypothetical protein